MALASTQDVVNALQMRGLTMNPTTHSARGESVWAISGDQQDGRRFVVEVSDHRIQRVRSGQDSIGHLIDTVLRAAVRAEDIRQGRIARQREQLDQPITASVSYGLPAIYADPAVPEDRIYGFTSERLLFNGESWPVEDSEQYRLYYDPITGDQRSKGRQQEGDLCYSTQQHSIAAINRMVREIVDGNRRIAEAAARRELFKPIEKKTRKIRI